MTTKSKRNHSPLADRMRPISLTDIIGHESVTGEGSILNGILNSMNLGGVLPSIIFWGPPGCGKTSLAKILAKETKHSFIDLTAISSGVKDLRQAIIGARKAREEGQNTIVFIDEIHRFNKSQQDTILGAVEDGTISFIGATTENPSFEVNRALLSRATVIKLNAISNESISRIIDKAIDTDELISEYEVKIDSKNKISEAAAGDARIALNILELALRMSYVKGSKELNITNDILEKAILGRARNYDKSEDYHYDNISAFIKSMRGSDPDAALFWLMNMIQGGEDPKFVARRMIIFASEDIGMADSRALTIANDCFTAIERIGLPEAIFALAHGVIYLSTAPKSCSVKSAIGSSKAAVNKQTNPEVPYHLRNGVTQLMKSVGYGKDYKYPHDYENNFIIEDYFPAGLSNRSYYQPAKNSEEKYILDLMRTRWGKRYD